MEALKSQDQILGALNYSLEELNDFAGYLVGWFIKTKLTTTEDLTDPEKWLALYMMGYTAGASRAIRHHKE
jgi:hypothetical protein